MCDLRLWTERIEIGSIAAKRHPTVSYVFFSSQALILLSANLTHADGTLRWQAPELMTGQSKLTPAIDVYAFAISCIEILTKGDLPWSHMDDDSVRYFSLSKLSYSQKCNISLTMTICRGEFKT
jgi:serine/threonine protein kinase